MEINYIFLKKEKKVQSKNGIQIEQSFPLYKQIFLPIAKKETLTENKFDIEYESQNFEIKYSFTNSGNGKYFIKIFTEGNENLKTAKVLNTINKDIKHSICHKDFYIVPTYDESSKYLCDKIYPKFNEFERKIRRLIYLILIEAFGILWAHETISEELKSKLKGKIHSSDLIIEQALQEMDISDLEDYLFKTRYWYNIEDIINNELLIENAKNMEKNQILEILSKFQKYSLWDKCFSEIKITDLEHNLNRIRELRNKIAHFKEISLEEYKESQELLKLIIKEIDLAINNFSLEHYTISLSTDILKPFFEMTQRLKETIDIALKPIKFSDFSKAITSLINQIELAKPKIPKTIFPKLENPILNSSITLQANHIINNFLKEIKSVTDYNMRLTKSALPSSLEAFNKQLQLSARLMELPKTIFNNK